MEPMHNEYAHTVRAMTERLAFATPVGGWQAVRAFQPWLHTVVPACLYPSRADHRWWSYRFLSPVAGASTRTQLEWFGQLMHRLGYPRRLATALDGFPYRSLYRYDRSPQRNWQWLCRAIEEYTQRPQYLVFISYGHPQHTVAWRQWYTLRERMPNLYDIYDDQTRRLIMHYRGVPFGQIGRKAILLNEDDQSLVSDG